MELEEDYMEYAIQFSLSLLAISATYFLDPNNIYSYGTLLLIPLLYGYTAYISRDGFKSCSFFSFVALIFAPLNAQMAALALIIGFGNVLVSFFSNGNSFRDYYNSVSLPMLFTSVILAGAFFYGATLQPEIGETVKNQVSATTADKTSLIIDETGIVDIQRDEHTHLMQETSTATVIATEGYVTNETGNDLDPEVMTAFQNAREEVPSQVQEQAINDTESMDISEQVEKAVQNMFEGGNIIYLAPLLAVLFYGLHPLVGILTAISAVSMRTIADSSE